MCVWKVIVRFCAVLSWSHRGCTNAAERRVCPLICKSYSNFIFLALNPKGNASPAIPATVPFFSVTPLAHGPTERFLEGNSYFSLSLCKRTSSPCNKHHINRNSQPFFEGGIGYHVFMVVCIQLPQRTSSLATHLRVQAQSMWCLPMACHIAGNELFGGASPGAPWPCCQKRPR